MRPTCRWRVGVGEVEEGAASFPDARLATLARELVLNVDPEQPPNDRLLLRFCFTAEWRQFQHYTLVYDVAMGKRKEETRSRERCRLLERACTRWPAEFIREKRLRWFGHQRQYIDEATRKILQMTVDGKRNRGRPKLKDDMARN